MQQSWSVSAQTRLLVVAPHPDDETLGCGLLIQQVLAAGGTVQILLLTDGDNNPWPQRYIERRLHIGPASRRRWGVRRRNEVMRALEQLGVPATALHPLGWQDMEVTGRLRGDPAGSIAAVRSVMQAFQPSLVCCPALRDSHPDHGAAHVLCRLALAGISPSPILLAYPVHGGAEPANYPVAIDASVDERERKLRALAEHHTQMVLSGARMRRLALGPELYVQIAGPPGQGRLPWRPPAAVRPWLRLLVATPDGIRDWNWRHAPLARDPDGAYRLSWPGHRVNGLAFAKLHLDWPSPWIFDHWGWHAL
ncbi:PIG-L family deacetylase [Dyella jejuensis]|uniref:PIG-L family deacetylase n=1 Tax=Dyella jejuensis TaxID=1432009 RepID=A0ABW8JGX5_9GAMM